MGMQEEFLEKIAEQKLIRISVRSICLRDGYLLVEQPSDDTDACYSFIGGELELGELLEEGLNREYQEEMGIEIKILRYLFVVENRFQINGKLVHAIEHYFQTEVEHTKITSQESHITQHWLSLENLKEYDVRPLVVRDAIFDGSWEAVKRLIAPFQK